MAFTTVNLQTQQLLESTFISDMRIIINANTILLKNSVQDAFNNLEIDVVGKKIGTDNPIASINSTDYIVGNSLIFKDGNTNIGSLTKSNSKSKLTVDNIDIKAGGLVNAIGLGTKIATTGLYLGVDPSTLTTNDTIDDLMYIGPAGELRVKGKATFSNSIVESAQTVNLQMTAVSGSTYSCDLTLTATTTSHIELQLQYPIAASSANALQSPVINVNLYTHSTNPPLKGQTFTFYVKAITGNNNTAVTTNPTVKVIGGTNAQLNGVSINQQGLTQSGATPCLKFDTSSIYGGSGQLVVMDATAAPYRLITTQTAGYCTVAQS